MNIKTLHMQYQEELKYFREELERNQEQKLTEANASIKKLEEKLEGEPSNQLLTETQKKLRQLD